MWSRPTNLPLRHLGPPLYWIFTSEGGGGHFVSFNPFKPEFTMVIFIHYKPQIAVAILDL